jgi:hypothetical protein
VSFKVGKALCLIVLEPVNDPFYDSSDKSYIFSSANFVLSRSIGWKVAGKPLSYWVDSGGPAVICQFSPEREREKYPAIRQSVRGNNSDTDQQETRLAAPA